jgi:hypothetical protein
VQSDWRWLAESRSSQASHEAPTVGQCARVEGADNVIDTDCDDPQPTLQVTSRHDNMGPGETGDTACADDLVATSCCEYHSGVKHTDVVSFVLCLADR